MIPYSLAKKLKDAGFPQAEGRGYYYTPSSVVKVDGERIVIPDEVYQPTLSELIEACGEQFSVLFKLSDCNPKGERWMAKSFAGKTEPWDGLLGSTPEEAVANLWLALNEHA